MTREYVVCALIAVVIVTLWIYFQWNECRNMGFSVLYCIQHVL